MFSQEFMRYLINYQKAEYKPEDKSEVKNFKIGSGGNRFAAILLTVKKS